MEDTQGQRKKYWNNEIKAMMGPCMITFAIPLTIPGVTITVVAFSKDKVFDMFGFWHLLGMTFLAVSLILLILGCIMRFLWKPFIGADLEMHLSPNPSLVSVRNKVGDVMQNSQNQARIIYTGNPGNANSNQSAPVCQYNKSLIDKPQSQKSRSLSKEREKYSNNTNDERPVCIPNLTRKQNNFNTNESNLGPESPKQRNPKEYSRSTTPPPSLATGREPIPEPKTPRHLEPLSGSYFHNEDLYSLSKTALELGDITKWRQRAIGRKKKSQKPIKDKQINSEEASELGAEAEVFNEENESDLGRVAQKDSDSEQSVALSLNENTDALLSVNESQPKHRKRRKQRRKKKKKGMFVTSSTQETKYGTGTGSSLKASGTQPLVGSKRSSLKAESEGGWEDYTEDAVDDDAKKTFKGDEII